MSLKRIVPLAFVVLLLLPSTALAKPRKERVCDDARRIASILIDVQANVNVSSDAWRVVVNEANALANRIAGRTSSPKAARSAGRDLRMHVREMRKAALNGDAAGARQHAREAMPFATTLITWACN